MRPPSKSLVDYVRSNFLLENGSDIRRRSVSGLKFEKSTVFSFGKTAEGKILASFLPDEIILNIDDFTPRTFECAVLFGDVSGFTELCEKYSAGGKGGSSKLTQVLNNYIGAMVQEIMSHNGDILKFSGDAFVGIWKKSKGIPMRDVVHIAIDCGLIIQKSYGLYETDVGVTIRVKLIIAAGPLTVSIIGDEVNAHYLEIGQPIWDIKKADAKCHAGDVIVSPRAWQYVSANEYLFQVLDTEGHVKVLGIGPSWRVITQDDDKTRRSIELNEMDYEASDEFSLRPAVYQAIALGLKEKMRKFIIKPVMNTLDLYEPLESEVRFVAVLMFNLELDIKEPALVLELGNSVYKCVCRIVNNYNGSVNKINFFDKDLLILVIFGFRRFKLDSECAVALKCSTECQHALFQIPGVRKVSIGVTTGKTYCGVFGHALRKEYTVISLSVNMAARLMINYPNKVTCDRNVYISSKLGTKNFILQEYKLLKGISNPGPIYEFIEIPPTHKHKMAVNPYPILGRQLELDLYEELVRNAENNYFDSQNTIKSERNKFHMMIIKSNRFLGKSRLLEECIYVTQNTTAVARCNLIPSDKKNPYVAIRLMFIHLLSGDNFQKYFIKKRLMSVMKDCPIPEAISSLEEVFHVGIETKPSYCELPYETKTVLINKALKFLSYKLFVTFWVVVISNLQYIDFYSWCSLHYLLKLKLFFVVASLSLDEAFFDYEHYPYVKVVTLQPLDKQYFCALACQLMQVDAVTPELEKLIQSNSEGKPGFIENFLVSMIQASDIIIKNMTFKEAQNKGFIVIPERSLKRLTKRERLKLRGRHQETDEGNIKDDYLEWSLYKECYRFSTKDISKHEALERKAENEKIVSVAILNKDFSLDTLNIESTSEVKIIQTFDSLTSFQQLILKVSSALLHNFPRAMLLFVMNVSSKREAALGIMTLFEKFVFCCAYGNFWQETDMLQIKGRMIDPYTITDVRCGCQGLIISECCSDLPKYASCGYLRFRDLSFKNIVYELLTDKQKKEFHTRAIKYLENETKRCKACGLGYFSDLYGERGLTEWRSLRTNLKGRKLADTHGDYIDLDVEFKHDDSIHGTNTLTKDSGRKATAIFIADNRSNKTMSRTSLELESVMRNCLFGFQTIRALKKKETLDRDFNQEDFLQCSCQLTLYSVYGELLQHAEGTGHYDKMLSATLKYAQLCTEWINISEAKRVIEITIQLLDNPVYTTKYVQWKLNQKRGKMFTYLGNIAMRSDFLDEAFKMYLTALFYFGYKFPRNKLSIKISTLINDLKHKKRYFIQSGITRIIECRNAKFHEDLAECLLSFSNLTMRLGKIKMGYLAATWALNEALVSNVNYIVLCKTFAQMIELNSQMGRKHFVVALETYSLRMVHMKRIISLPDDVKATAVLYSAIFLGRMFRSELDVSRDIGIMAWKMGHGKNTATLMVNGLPLLMINTLYRKLLDETRTVLQEMDIFAREDKDITGTLNYFSLCIVLQLETGYVFESFASVRRFLKSQAFDTGNPRELGSRTRLLIIAWLWFVRNNQWEMANFWEFSISKLKLNRRNENLINLIWSLYILEGQIMILVSEIEKRNIVGTMRMYKKIDAYIAKIDSCREIAPIIIPRLTHLKAYYRLVKTNDYVECLNELQKAKKYALKFNNILEHTWIEHSEKVWKNELAKEEMDYWKNHSEFDTIDISHLDVDDTKPFSLPLPDLV